MSSGRPPSAAPSHSAIPPVSERREAISLAFGPEWTPTVFDAYLEQLATTKGTAPLILGSHRLWTYEEVWKESEAVAKALLSRGVRPGDRVALIIANHPEFVPMLFGAWRIGASVIPVNFLFQTAELAYVIEQSECSAVISMDCFRTQNYLAMFDQLVPGWSDPDGRTAWQTRFPHLLNVVIRPDDAATFDRPYVRTYADLVEEGRIALLDEGLPNRGHQPDDVAVVMYTSGTTGRPKGVIQTHDNLMRMAVATAHHRAFESARRILFALPLYHAFGLVEGLLAATVVGGAIAPQVQFDPSETLAAIAEHHIAELLLVPTMAVAILDSPVLHDYDISSLISVLIGAAATPVPVWKRIQTSLAITELFTGYGMTELTAAVTHTAPDDTLETITTTVGRPKLAGPAGIGGHGGQIALLKTVDPLTGDDLATGSEGELAIWGPTCTDGYFNLPEETGALRLPGGWVRSGDLGRVLADGSVQLTGRSKELYKSGGELVAPQEVEHVISEHALVSQCFVVGVTDPVWGEIGCAWIVRATGPIGADAQDAGQVTDDELRQQLIDWCSTRLANFKRPKMIRFLEVADLPLTPTGKVQKFKLAQRSTS